MPRNTNAGNGGKYNSRRWYIPSKRAKNYAEERKAKVHQRGPKEGRELTDYEAGHPLWLSSGASRPCRHLQVQEGTFGGKIEAGSARDLSA